MIFFFFLHENMLWLVTGTASLWKFQSVPTTYVVITHTPQVDSSATTLWTVLFPAAGCLVCVEVLRPSQPNGVMSSAVSLPNHMFTG